MLVSRGTEVQVWQGSTGPPKQAGAPCWAWAWALLGAMQPVFSENRRPRQQGGSALSGTRRTMMGMGGRYLDTRLTVRPDCTITMISPALIFSAVLHAGVGCATERLVVPRSSLVVLSRCWHGSAMFSRWNQGSGVGFNVTTETRVRLPEPAESVALCSTCVQLHLSSQQGSAQRGAYRVAEDARLSSLVM